MKQKLNRIVHDRETGTIYISLRPKTHRRPKATLEYPGRIILDLDAEGDVYGVRFMKVSPEAAEKILKLLQTHLQHSGDDTATDTKKIEDRSDSEWPELS